MADAPYHAMIIRLLAERATAQSDLVSRFGGALGAVWMGGAVIYAMSCMHFAY